MESEQPKSSKPVSLVLEESDRFKVAQAIYNVVTGKTEKLTKAFNKSYLITLDSLKQLHHKCSQACTQWDVLQKNCSITVNHAGDNQETFSSFERFNIYDVSRTTPVESIVYEFNILIRIPKVERPQNYKVTVRLMSRLAAMKRMDDDLPPPFFRLFGQGAVIIEIEYVDYVVARNLLGMVESWVNEIEQHSAWSWASHVRRVSHWIPRLFQLVVLAVTSAALISSSDAAMGVGATSAQLAKWIIFSGACLWVVVQAASIVGDFVEESFDSVIDLSVIKLNLGDERLLKEYSSRNMVKTISGIFGVAFIVVLSIFANLLTNWLVKFFSFLPK